MIELNRISKTYQRADGTPVIALHEISFQIAQGEFISVRGRSGSGKSSLLNILGCLDVPSSGSFCFAGNNTALLSDPELSRLRCLRIGFIFQAFNLLPRTTALENVLTPMIYAGIRPDKAKGLAALERVGLRERAHHFGTELSGGEQQRVAVARALINRPQLLLADEPTGNLDLAAGRDVMQILASLHRDEGRTVVLVTHDDAVARFAKREIWLEDGRVRNDIQHSAEEVAQ